MAGAKFRVDRRIKTIRLEGDRWAGAWVKVSQALPIGKFLAVADLMRNVGEAGTGNTAQALAVFARVGLIEWNLTDEEGADIPATEEGLLGLPLELALAITNAWMEGMALPPAPLSQPSANGEPSRAASGMMAGG